MIDILLVERKEKIYRKDFLLRRVFRIGRKQPKQCGVKLWATYIYIYAVRYSSLAYKALLSCPN